MRKLLIRLLTALALCASVNRAAAQGTAFTYQGRLNNGANPANGSYDMTFALYTASSGGTQVGNTLTNLGVGVTNGLFVVTNDFGAVYGGSADWLQIEVRTNGGSSFSPLNPRQELTPTPYAVYAENSSLTPYFSAPGTSIYAGQAAGNATSSGGFNVAVGYASLLTMSSGSYNTASGYYALNSNSSGSDNTANGADALSDNGSGSYNTAVGGAALGANTTGSSNVAVGYFAVGGNRSDNGVVGIGYGALQNENALNNGNTSSGTGENTAVGYLALQADTTGSANTAVGYSALLQNVNGYDNTAIGDNALRANTNGYGNTAVGELALSLNNANYNTAVGYDSMAGPIFSPITGGYNTAEGADALVLDSTGANNVAVGASALELNTTGGGNTSVGAQTLSANGIGYNNTVMGYDSIPEISESIDNVAIGVATFQAATEGIQNTAVGTYAFQLTTAGDGNIGLGYHAGYNLNAGSNNIYIGSLGSSSDNNIIRIGSGQTQTYIAGTIQHAVCSSITIVGGADLAEPFPISSMELGVSEGSVVVIDEDNPGQLKLSSKPYDTRVAGVVSGANGINPGIEMQQEGVLAGGKNVALTGRVYVQADTSNGSIRPGDLLTTSHTPGRAMKVTNHTKAQGAILGKAMTGLKDGQGMVLVLVTLQ